MKKYTVKLSDDIIGICEGVKVDDNTIDTGCDKVQCLELVDLECEHCIMTPCRRKYPIELFEEVEDNE